MKSEETLGSLAITALVALVVMKRNPVQKNVYFHSVTKTTAGTQRANDLSFGISTTVK